MKIRFLQEKLLEDFFVPNGRTKQCLIKLIVINDLIGYGYWLLTTMDAPKKNIFNDVLPSKETAAKDLEILNIAIMLGQTGGHGYVGATAIVFAFIACIFIQII